MGPLATGSSDADTLHEWLRVPEPARVDDRLRVYADGYPVRVHDSLTEAYPAVAHLVGEPAFAALAQHYAASVPLTSYNLSDAGVQMPAFLRRDPLTRALPFLPDLAALEWHLTRAFHAAERPPLDPRTLSWTIEDWADAVLHFQPSVAVIASAWPLLDLWTARETGRQAIDIELCGRPDDVVVRRAGLSVECESIAADEALALRLLLDGRTLAETTERLEADEHDPSTVLGWFTSWMSAGLIAGASRSQARAGLPQSRGAGGVVGAQSRALARNAREEIELRIEEEL